MRQLRKAPTAEQERIRARLKTAGVHVLLIDAARARLDEILSKEEASRYLGLVSEGGFGLGLIDQTVVAIAPDSPLRPHFGTSPHLVGALRRRGSN